MSLSVSKLSVISLAVLMSGYFVAGACAQDKYEIKLDRPHKAGETFPVQIKFKLSQTGGPEDKKVAVSLTGEEKIVEVDDKGGQTCFNLTVDRCMSGDDELIANGAVIEVSARNGRDSIQMNVDGVPFTEEQRTALGEALAIGKEEGLPEMSEVFGNKKPQGRWRLVGGRHGRPPEAAAARLADAD